MFAWPDYRGEIADPSMGNIDDVEWVENPERAIE